jgi:hypothetical protein
MNRDNPRTKIKKRQQIARTFLFSGFIDKPIPHSVPKYNNPKTPARFSNACKKTILGQYECYGIAEEVGNGGGRGEMWQKKNHPEYHL